MAEAEPAWSYRVLRYPAGTDLDGAVVELHEDFGFVTMDIRVPARQQPASGEDELLITR